MKNQEEIRFSSRVTLPPPSKSPNDRIFKKLQSVRYDGDIDGHYSPRNMVLIRGVLNEGLWNEEYIIEHNRGWKPFPYWIKKFKLNPLRKYIIVRSHEITPL